MESHNQLIRRAKRMGYDVTPLLSAELLTLASVSDEQLLRRAWVRSVANDCKVSVAMAEARLEGLGLITPDREG